MIRHCFKNDYSCTLHYSVLVLTSWLWRQALFVLKCRFGHQNSSFKSFIVYVMLIGLIVSQYVQYKLVADYMYEYKYK